MLKSNLDTSVVNPYTVTYTPTAIKVINTETKGFITFHIQGEDTLEGNFKEGTVLNGGKLVRKLENDDRIQLVSFDLSCNMSYLVLNVSNYYKRDIEIENDGIVGEVVGDMEFQKDINVFVEGNPVIAGFTNESKTQFVLAPIYGEMTSHWDIVEDVYYKGIDLKKGEKNYAKLSVLRDETPIRMLCQPEGFNAIFTIASHADRANVKVTKAVFYGTSNEASSEYKTKGLLSYGLKGTISVFAASEDLKYSIKGLFTNIKSLIYSLIRGNIINQTKAFIKYCLNYFKLIFTGELSSIHDSLKNPKFKALIDDAYNQGIEIVPHTMTLYADNRSRFERYLPVFQKNYNSKNFIDHYLFAHNESSGLHSSGNKPESKFYIMDLMQKYGYQHAWSYQDTSVHNEIKNQIFPEHFQFPRHLVYTNKKLTFPNGAPVWQYKCTNRLLHGLISGTDSPTKFLKELIKEGGYCTDHNYFTGSFGYLYTIENKEYKINPRLDKFLSFLKDKKASGEIWNPTQSELNEHMIKLMDIELTKIGKYHYQIFSKNDEPLNVSFMIKGTYKGIEINANTANTKMNENTTIFWGNIKKGVNTIVVKK